MAVKPSKPKTSKKQKPEKKSSQPKKRKPVTSKTNNNNVRTTQQGLVNQAAKTGNQTTVVRINNALAKASARVNRRYAGIPKTPTPYTQPSIGIAPAFNIQFPSMGANYENGMREVNGMRNEIINEFRRLNPHAAYAPPPPPPAPPGAGAVAAAPPPMSEHPDAVYEEPALAPEGPAAPSNAGSVGGGGSAAMSIDSEHTAPVAHEAEHTAPVAPEAPGAPEASATEAPKIPFMLAIMLTFQQRNTYSLMERLMRTLFIHRSLRLHHRLRRSCMENGVALEVVRRSFPTRRRSHAETKKKRRRGS
jgi:hypothetical protein